MNKDPRLQIATDFSLPIDAVTGTFGLLAIRGSGKTYTSAVIVEEMIGAGQPVCILDPVGVWWGLRSNAAGDGPGLPVVVMGGDHGDLPLEQHSGAAIADLVIDERLPLVLDLSLLRKGQQQTFVVDFAERLYHRNRSPLHLVIDEADAFAPQRPLPGQQRMLGAIEDLVRRGRARGIGVTLITQRPAVLNKDVLTQVQALIVLRLVSPQDRKAIDTWVEAHGTMEERNALMDSLASLPIGDAWVWSPGWLGVFERVSIRRRETFDSSATPKVGETRIEPRVLANVDLDRLRDRLAEVVQTAEESDPKLLQKRIAELTRQLAAKPKAEPERIVERVEVPVMPADAIAALRSCCDVVERNAETILTELFRVRETLTRLEHGEFAAEPKPDRKPMPAINPAKARPDPTPAGDTSLRRGERVMLETVAAFADCGLTRAQLGFLAKFAPSGGTFSTYLGTLKRAGLIEERDKRTYPTDAGEREADVVLIEGADRLELWRANLRPGELRMLDVLVELFPAAIGRRELGHETGFTASGGTFSTYLGTLRRLGLIETTPGGGVRAMASAWFPIGEQTAYGQAKTRRTA